MPVYVALLRGVNLGGHKRMKMERLRESFEALGFRGVQTCIQSGNVIFKSAKTSPAALSKKIEERILEDFGFPAPVITRTHEELAAVIENNPFAQKRGIDVTRLHVTFLADAPTAPALTALAGLTSAPDEHCCRGREIFLHLPNGMGKSSLMNNPIDRRWLRVATTRNWNTVNKILELCQACG